MATLCERWTAATAQGADGTELQSFTTAERDALRNGSCGPAAAAGAVNVWGPVVTGDKASPDVLFAKLIALTIQEDELPYLLAAEPYHTKIWTNPLVVQYPDAFIPQDATVKGIIGSWWYARLLFPDPNNAPTIPPWAYYAPGGQLMRKSVDAAAPSGASTSSMVDPVALASAATAPNAYSGVAPGGEVSGIGPDGAGAPSAPPSSYYDSSNSSAGGSGGAALAAPANDGGASLLSTTQTYRETDAPTAAEQAAKQLATVPRAVWYALAVVVVLWVVAHVRRARS
jgi:hypothetical protein